MPDRDVTDLIKGIGPLPAGDDLFKTFRIERGNNVHRLIRPDEGPIIEQAVAINNRMWGEGLHTTAQAMSLRARNGYLIGAFNQGGGLEGTISCLRIRGSELAHCGEPGHWTSTWDGVTGKGTFSTNQSDGDVLACVSITSRSSKPAQLRSEVNSWKDRISGGIERDHVVSALSELNWDDDERMARVIRQMGGATVAAYLATGIDYVKAFHGRPKGGILGARLMKIIPEGRPNDRNSLGYNDWMRYPPIGTPLNEQPRAPDDEVSVADALIESAYQLGGRLGVTYVDPYSRPAGLRMNLARVLRGESVMGRKTLAPREAKMREAFVRTVNQEIGEVLQNVNATS